MPDKPEEIKPEEKVKEIKADWENVTTNLLTKIEELTKEKQSLNGRMLALETEIQKHRSKAPPELKSWLDSVFAPWNWLFDDEVIKDD